MAESNEATPADVRTWALAKGIEVGVRGRISKELKAAYNRGHRVKIAA